MKALFSLKSAINQSSLLCLAALILMLPVAYPEIVMATEPQTLGPSALVFDINTQNQSSLSYNQLAGQDPLVQKLKQYLQDKNSPLADSADKIVSFANWKRALGISLVESNMCRFTPKYYSKGKITESYNCSGIGGDNFKRYNSYIDWLADMDSLLSQPNYANRPIEKFIGYYVQPGSRSWLYGAKTTEAELTDIQTQAQAQRLALTSNLQLAFAGTYTNIEVK